MKALGVLGLRGGLGGGGNSAGPAAYLGQVATRSAVPTGLIGGNTVYMSRRAMKTRQAITSLQALCPNYYVTDPAGLAETGPGAAATITASIEYPAGTFTQIRFGGSTSGNIPNGGSLLTDACAVNIPNDTWFWFRAFVNCASGVVLNGSGYEGSVALGDLMNTFDGDKTMSGTVSNQFAGYAYTPLAIIAQTVRPSILLQGTSRMAGVSDTQDSSGAMGIVARSIEPNFAYINAGRASDSLVKYIASHTQRLQLANYVSHVVLDVANDDVGGGLATTQANLATVIGYFTALGKKVMMVTSDPSTTGAWTLANQTDQTVQVNYTNFNNHILTLPAGLQRVFDIRTVTSTGVANKWNADGTVGKYTPDGIHETQFTNLAIKASGVIPASAFVR